MVRMLTGFLAALAIGLPQATAQYLSLNPPYGDEQEIPYLTPEPKPTKNCYFRAEAIYLKYLSGAADQEVAIFSEDGMGGTPGPTALSTGDLSRPGQWGPKLTLGCFNDCGFGWETSYFGLFDGRSSRSVFDEGNLSLPGALGDASFDFRDIDEMLLSSETELHSFEINSTHRIGHWTWLCGIRYLRLADELNIRGIDDDLFDSDYNVRARNNLFGVQAGLRRGGCFGRFGWDVTAKGGIYGNSTTQSQFVTDYESGDSTYYLREPVSANANQVAFIGEVNPNLTFCVTDKLLLTAGYQLLWIEGVSLAANQLDFSNSAFAGSSNHSTGGVLLHGLSAGLEFRW